MCCQLSTSRPTLTAAKAKMSSPYSGCTAASISQAAAVATMCAALHRQPSARRLTLTTAGPCFPSSSTGSACRLEQECELQTRPLEDTSWQAQLACNPVDAKHGQQHVRKGAAVRWHW